MTGGETSGPAMPTRTIRAAIAQTGVVDGTAARIARPAVMHTSPVVIRNRAPTRSAIRALSGVKAAPASIIGKNATPVAKDERPRCCWR